MSRVPDDQATRILHQWLGGARPRLLGEGMEGAVYEIDDTHVAKLWFAGSAERLRRMAAFYTALEAKPLSFSVPRITRIETVEGRAVTIERRFTGETLSASKKREDAYAMIVGIVAELATAGELPAARDLAVLDEATSLFTTAESFPEAIAGLAARRVERFRPTLSGAIDRLDEKAAALARRLREVDSGRRAVIHGDLFPGNVLVGRTTAVLDWGFLTTEGDPAFDAAVAAAIFDMYGPDATRTERELQDRMGYDRTTMLVYRAAYSLITANAYDPAGRDGHFAWCVTALNRADITRALLG